LQSIDRFRQDSVRSTGNFIQRPLQRFKSAFAALVVHRMARKVKNHTASRSIFVSKRFSGTQVPEKQSCSKKHRAAGRFFWKSSIGRCLIGVNAAHWQRHSH
jgi:hypothetical protein